MHLVRFIFGFLYIRNWHSGAHELSRPRLAVFASALFLIFLGLLIVTILQNPVQYAV